MMYYGNANLLSYNRLDGVYDSNYVGVYHLGEESGGTNAIKDSSSLGNDGTNFGTNPIFGLS